MYGALLGDMIGSVYEFDRSPKRKEFPLFSPGSTFTDDSVMTAAVADALLQAGTHPSQETVKRLVMDAMKQWGRRYPDAGYGGMFYRWLFTDETAPYNSWGNGSAMRTSPVGWLYETMEETLRVAKWTAEVTHSHPEGIKGAQAVSAGIYLARNGAGKEEIKTYLTEQFGYDLSRTCDEIRTGYHHVESCQETVPEAVTAFLEGTDFEDVIRCGVSLGGDADTLTCIAGGIAEAFYGVPEALKQACRKRLTPEMCDILDAFERKRMRPVRQTA